MTEFRKMLRESLPELIGGLIVATLTLLVTTSPGIAALVGLVGALVIAVLAYLVHTQDGPEAGWAAGSPAPGRPYAPSEAGKASFASIGMLYRIPAGPAIIGSHFHIREAPPRQLFVAEFEIAAAPVLVSQYNAFINAGAADEARWWSEDGWAWRQSAVIGWGRADRSKPHDWVNQKNWPYDPVVGVTWYEAEAYCRWLSAQKNRRVRLPSEEQWEKAARGENGRTWPWGESFNRNKANTCEHGVGGTLAAGTLAADRSPYGLTDLGGNVQDWTSSVYQPLPGEQFPAEDLRVARGGSWNDTAFGARASFRHVYPPGYYFSFLGFRVVVERL
jgi:formylglycine-generating enzyme required for sulfatase activity